MNNWKNSNIYKITKKALRSGEEITMPHIATGAFKLISEGKLYKLQLRANDYEKEALRLHKLLLSRGWNLPRVMEIRKVDGHLFTVVEWWGGETGLEARDRTGKLPDDYYYKLGQWVSKLHNETEGGRHIAMLNYWPRNTLIRPSGEVIGLDLNKLYLTDFPECFTIKYIVAETPSVSKSQREAFLKGYRENREWDYKRIIRKYLSKFRIYHDVYLDGKLFYKGARPVKDRLEMMKLPEDMSNMYVLDLGYANGMFSLECAQRGAKVYACDSNYKNIGPAHHRISDIAKLIAVYHGFTEEQLLYKHIDINTDNFMEKHIPNKLNHLPNKKYDIVFALAIADHMSPERKEKFFHMLDNITDCLYYESRMGGRRELEEARLKKLTTFDNIEYLGNASTNAKQFRYALFKCTRKKRGG